MKIQKKTSAPFAMKKLFETAPFYEAGDFINHCRTSAPAHPTYPTKDDNICIEISSWANLKHPFRYSSAISWKIVLFRGIIGFVEERYLDEVFR